MKRTLVLGAGFGGLAVATELRRLLGKQHDIVLIDRREHFLVGLRKLWALVGLGALAEGQRSRRSLNRRDLVFLEHEVRQIEPANRRVVTDQEAFEADDLVVALGAEPRADLIPGLAEHAHNLYDVDSIPGLIDAVARFDGGRIAILIAGGPYKCPPAPFECAMLLEEHLRERGLRQHTEIEVITFQPILLPNAGTEGSAWLAQELSSRGIRYRTGCKLQKVEPGRALFVDGASISAEVLVGVPPHRPPRVVRESGLTGEGDWVPIDPATLRTAHERVFAIGDVTQIQLANGLPFPKAGLFAELQGLHVAATIAADCGVGSPPRDFDGRGFCFVEMGKSLATRVEGDFFARPEPQVRILEASASQAEAKRRFESERLQRWFGG